MDESVGGDEGEGVSGLLQVRGRNTGRPVASAPSRKNSGLRTDLSVYIKEGTNAGA